MRPELLYPQALWLLAILLPLVVLYILKIRRQRRRVSSTWLWQEARRDLMARSPFKRLIVQLPLILQALALIALALAASRPANRSKALSGDHIAIIIDSSASMSAQIAEHSISRMDRAKQIAHDLLARLPPGSDAMLLDAGRDARVALPSDRDIRRLQNAVAALEALPVEGDLGDAIALAVSRMKQLGGRRRIIVITDGNLANPSAIDNPTIELETILVGEPISNAAIVRVDVRSGVDPVSGRQQLQAFLLVANFSNKAKELFVTMRQRNASDVLDSRRVLVPAGNKLPVVLTFYPTPGDYGSGLIFDISPHDAMPVDNIAFGRVPAGRKLPVVVASATKPSPWLLRALVSDPDAEVRSIQMRENWDEQQIPNDAFVVVENKCPATIPGGNLLIVNPPAGKCFGTEVAEELLKPAITSWRQADPRLRFISLDGVFVQQARLLKPDSKQQELIVSARGAIASDISTNARPGTLLGFDVGESNWPLKASFVVFLRNLLEEARAHRNSGLSGPAIAGTPLRVKLPIGVRDIQVLSPNEKTRRVRARDGLAIVPVASRVGFYQIDWEHPSSGDLLVPVNLSSAPESDTRQQRSLASGPAGTPASPQPEIASFREHSWWLALLALAFVLFDIWYLTRRPRALRLDLIRKPQRPQRQGAES